MQKRLQEVIKALGLNTTTDDIVFILYNYPEISSEWLIRGKGSMYLCDPQSNEEAMVSQIDALAALLRQSLQKNQVYEAALAMRSGLNG